MGPFTIATLYSTCMSIDKYTSEAESVDLGKVEAFG